MTKILPRNFLVLVAVFSLAACSESTAPADNSQQTQAAAPVPTSAALKGVIPQAQLDAMAKAADVSNVLEQAEQERRKQMEAQGL